MRSKCAVFLFVIVLSAVMAQTGYLPPNPISPPTVSAPAMTPLIPLSPVASPEVAGPSIQMSPDTGPATSMPDAQAQSPATGNRTTAANAGKAGDQSTLRKTGMVQTPTRTVTEVTGNKPDAQASSRTSSSSSAQTGAKAGSAKKDDLSSVSALSLLGLGGDNPLLEALNGSSNSADSVDALSGLLGGKTASGSTGSTGGASLQKILSLLQTEQSSKNSASAGVAGSGSSPAGTSKATQSAVPASAGSMTATVPGKKATTSQNIAAASNAAGSASGAEILRFSVNGYSISASVTTLVSSIIARDGSFLLTGDRAYPSSPGLQTETFYLFCKKTGQNTYRLSADVSQGTTVNKKSFLYQLVRKTPLTGTLTGDLLVFRTADSAWKLDLVIRIFNPTVNTLSVR